MELKMNPNKINIGNAGEYFVAAELERRGYTVGIPMSNVKDFDILAIDNKSNMYSFQIKTKNSIGNKWVLSKKDNQLSTNNSYFIFVNLNKENLPDYYIIPYNKVIHDIEEAHKKWLDTPGKNGKKHKDNNLRTYFIKEDEYKNNWGILQQKKRND